MPTIIDGDQWLDVDRSLFTLVIEEAGTPFVMKIPKTMSFPPAE
ncbi:MAG: hypothetical protein PHR28_08755 [candidate division Zixibacteria bacterium]|nr:hypothetical protein [candidate division Zixibacteria bacterium]